MKNNLWIILISVVITLSSCITAAQFNNAEDDVYYSPKTSNRKQPVMIPEVDIDEIIRQNPPKYGEPTNRLDEEYNSNPMAAMYYPAYRSFPQDSTYQQNSRVSTYIDPSLATQSETEEAAYLRQMYSDNSTNWNMGVGLSWMGQLFSLGYNNYNSAYYGCNSYYYPYGYPSNGCGYGYGYNNYYNPYYYGAGYGYGYGGGYYYHPTHVTPHHENTNTGISRPRPTVGNYTPPVNAGRNTETPHDVSPSGRYVAPPLPSSTNQPTRAEIRRSRRAANSSYTPSAPQQSLENENGRQVYRRPVETTQPAQQSSETKPAYSNRGSSSRRQTSNEASTNRNSSPTYNAPSQHVSTPSNAGRSSSSSQGSGRSSGSSSSGSQSSGGRRR